ncbi:tripartite tricarboxylate transporter TctB family protein [Paenibacillus alkalitolerans]|uniref:tripartite tricarboxylate transporter TctB family protein n=1 Tax=Paenibacillus alkalitolerans TaxID=2799335 RepID=UPI0018F47AAA|nr:tripartite tricarboxylate transporter TctB family protein [Paenibacillus alkalitolerans]
MNKTFDRYASVAMFIVGAAFVMESRNISTSAYGSNVGPNIFPLGLGIILLLLSARLFYETFRYPDKANKKEGLDYKRFFIILGAAVAYALLLEPIGYVITTFAFLALSFQVMERGGWWKTLVISGAFSIGVYYLFVEVLQGSLPGLPVWFR